VTLDPKIYGHGTTEHIVNISAKRGQLHIYRETPKGVTLEVTPYQPWVLSEVPLDDDFEQLDGDNAYKYVRMFSTEKAFREFKRNHRSDVWSPRGIVEQYLLTSGNTYFKGTMRKDVSILCMDIETTGLHLNDSAKVLMIANTYRKGDMLINKLFSLDDYRSQRDLFDAWAEWVRQMNPSILATYNGLAFDFPYLIHCAKRAGACLRLGRDGSELELELYESKFRQDASRSIAYRMPRCHGREIVDLFFVVQKWDIGKKFSRYSLKTVIKEAGLEREDRTMVNAAMIWQYYDRRHSEPEVWQQVKDYAAGDGLDTLAMWDMVGDAYFYSSQVIPFTFERMCLSASGAQLNALMVRYYLAKGHSIAKTTDKVPYQGAISFGNPGVYDNIFKIDVSSLYPSIITSFNLFDESKDPDAFLVYMNNFFRVERLKFKKLAKDTGEEYYAAMDAVFKALVNSVYGFCGAGGCNYNAPHIAAKVTEEGRNILTQSIDWANNHGFCISNADTDSISFTVPSSEPAYLKGLLAEVNGLMRDGIRFEDDGFFPKFVVLKAKNYIMLTPEGKIKLKGSALKSSRMEKGLKDFQGLCIRSLLGLSGASLIDAYLNTCKGLSELTSVLMWCSRKTISERTLKSARKNERSLVEAMKGTSYQIGDKFDFYYTADNVLKLADNFDPSNPDHNVPRLLGKLYTSSKLFQTVLPDFSQRINYGLLSNYRKYNDLMRAKVLVEKVKKPSVKNSLQELMNLLVTAQMVIPDDYARNRVEEALNVALILLKPKEKVAKDPDAPKKTRKKKETPSEASTESVDSLF